MKFNNNNNNNNNNIHLYSVFLLVIQSALQSVNTKKTNNSNTTWQDLKAQLTGGNQLVIYKSGWRFELGMTENKSSRIWTRDDWEQIQQVARAGLEPGTAGLQVRPADHSATLPPCLILLHNSTGVILYGWRY